MHAIVVAIESGASFVDRERRIRLRVTEAELFSREFTVRESWLGVIAVNVDDQLEMELHPMTMHARRERDAAGVTKMARQIVEDAGNPCANPLCLHSQIDHGGDGRCHAPKCGCGTYRISPVGVAR